MQKLSDLGDLNHNRLEVQNDPVHVSKLVHRLALIYGEKAQVSGVDIEVDVDAGLASFSLDQQKLYRVITNLLDCTLAMARMGKGGCTRRCGCFYKYRVLGQLLN